MAMLSVRSASGSVVLGLMLATAGCQKPEAPAPVAAESESVAPSAPCADDGPRFPVSGLCVGRSINYLDPTRFLQLETPDGCTWTMNETPFATPDEVLIYRALSCKGVVTTLEYGGGAHSAQLTYKASALYPDSNGVAPVRIFTSDPADPQLSMRNLIKELPTPENTECAIRPAGIDGWPADALVIAPTEAALAKAPKDEPLAACGEFGVDEDAQTFWRISQGYAWYFMLGQDSMDFDPGSISLMQKGADGTWGPAPY